MKILIAEDHEMVRDGIKKIMASDYDVEQIVEAVDGEEAVNLTHKFKPDIILMDITMPKMDGIEATHQILIQNPSFRIIMLSYAYQTRSNLGCIQGRLWGICFQSCDVGRTYYSTQEGIRR